ncbi:MAG TPA: hypothetical protein VJU87_05780 [Gemmatimonadaceae bacterium]|nr:hypothetical protein [Gemmatimonadaceae bacterium]
MPIDVIPVRGSRALRQFIDVPWRIYDTERYPRWVPPLRLMVRDAVDTKKNPMYRAADRELFLAVRDGRVVGRVAAVENRAHNEFHGDRVGFFGFYESFEDQEAANALFGAAHDWLARRGLEAMRGPMSPSTNAECGLLVDGFDQHPMFMTPWNPPYYLTLFEQAGLAPVKDLLGYQFPFGPQGIHSDARTEAHARRAAGDAGVSFRSIDMRHFRADLDRAWEIYNSAWDRNWGFVPMSYEEFTHMARDLKPLIRPDWALVAEVNGTAAGFFLALPDFNVLFKRIGNGRLLPTGLYHLLTGKMKLRTGRVLLLGVKPEYRTRSIFALLLHEILRRGYESGVETAEASWILEDNLPMRRPLERLGARVYRRWRIYERPVVPAAAR